MFFDLRVRVAGPVVVAGEGANSGSGAGVKAPSSVASVSSWWATVLLDWSRGRVRLPTRLDTERALMGIVGVGAGCMARSLCTV